MFWNLFNAVWMGVLTLVMAKRAKFSAGRRMMYIPLMMCVVELMLANVLTPGLAPVLTAMLVVARLTVTVCCVGELRREAAYMKRRARIRRLARQTENVGLVIPMFGAAGQRRVSTAFDAEKIAG